MYLRVSSRIVAKFIFVSHGMSFSSDLIFSVILLRLLPTPYDEGRFGDFEEEDGETVKLFPRRRRFKSTSCLVAAGRGGARERHGEGATSTAVECSKDWRSGKWRNGVGTTTSAWEMSFSD